MTKEQASAFHSNQTKGNSMINHKKPIKLSSTFVETSKGDPYEIRWKKELKNEQAKISKLINKKSHKSLVSQIKQTTKLKTYSDNEINGNC